jgi:hypothetical protein
MVCLRVFFGFDEGEERGHVGFWFWARKRWNFFSFSQREFQREGKVCKHLEDFMQAKAKTSPK